MHMPNFVVSEIKVYQICFAERGRDRCRSNRFPLVDILINSGANHDPSLKLSEIAPNFVRFGHIFRVEEAPKFLEPRL